MAFPNRIELQWQGTFDNTNGIGVYAYVLYRDGVFLYTSGPNGGGSGNGGGGGNADGAGGGIAFHLTI